MTYHKNDKIAILVKGVIVETFTNARTTPCCDKMMTRYVVMHKGLEFGKFTLMKL